MAELEKIKLEEGEMICNKCNGTGSIIHRISSQKFDVFETCCPKCLGSGKLDWVELCVGKKPSTAWEKLVFPTVRITYPKLIAKDLVSVQPINWGK